MRDNVLFEIGLCSMALGLDRTILLTDHNVRLPDDLIGLNGNLALKQIYLSRSPAYIAAEVDAYIRATGNVLHQVIIGAACSTACGYATNFVIRTLERITDGIQIRSADRIETVHVPREKIHMHIRLPYRLDIENHNRIKASKGMLQRGSVPSARSRPAEFEFFFQGDELHIVDYPTSIVTSYDTAKIILEMDADDILDQNAAKRFTAKELNLFEATLRSLLNSQFVHQAIYQHYPNLSEDEKARICADVDDIITNRVTVTRETPAE